MRLSLLAHALEDFADDEPPPVADLERGYGSGASPAIGRVCADVQDAGEFSGVNSCLVSSDDGAPIGEKWTSFHSDITPGETMSKLVALPIALLVVAALSGCASAAPADLQTPTTTQQAEVKEDSTPEQWASLVAQQQAGWEDWQDGWDEAGCSSLAAAAGAMDCQLMLTSASFMVQTTSIEHELAVSAGKKGFIATTPPAEVAICLVNSPLQGKPRQTLVLRGLTLSAAPPNLTAVQLWRSRSSGRLMRFSRSLPPGGPTCDRYIARPVAAR